MLDIFRDDMFGVVSLTNSINKLPYVPQRIGAMGLFGTKGVPHTTIVIEERHGKLSIIPTSARGGPGHMLGGTARRGKAVAIPHIKQVGAVMADDVQGVRAFDSEDATETVAQVVNDKLAEMRQNIEVTHEWHRIGALKGVVLDADGSTEIVNWYDEFDITPEDMSFDFTAGDDVKLKANAITRHMQDALGMTPMRGVHAFCGSAFYDELVTCDEVKGAFDRWQDGQFLRDSQARSSFEYAGIVWEEYRGSVGNIDFIDENQARFFPTGVPDLFQVAFGPADYVETVNTIGKPVYAKQEQMKFDRGVDMESQSNPLFICTRPAALVMGWDEATGS